MIIGNLEIVINNGDLRQILMLPETPVRIVFVFQDKELVLREQLGKAGLYFISHHRGFSETAITHKPTEEPTLQCETEINNIHGDNGKTVSKGDASNFLVNQTNLNILPTGANLMLLKPDGVKNLPENSAISNSQVPQKFVCLPLVLQNNLKSILKNPTSQSSLVSQNAQVPHYIMVANKNELVTQPDAVIASLEKERTNAENNSKVVCETNNESEMVIGVDPAWFDESRDIHVQSTDYRNNLANETIVRKEDEEVTQLKANDILSEKERTKLDVNSSATCESDKTLGNEIEMAIDADPVWSDESCDSHVQSTDYFNNLANETMVRKEDGAVAQLKANNISSEKERFKLDVNSSATCESNKTLGNESEITVDMSLGKPDESCGDPNGVKILNEDCVNTSLHEKPSHSYKSRNNRRCELCNARHYQHPTRSFFRFPNNKETCQKWLAICNKPYLMKITPEALRRCHLVCSEHFAPSDFASKKGKRNRIYEDAVPSCNLSLIQSMKAKLQLALHKSANEQRKSISTNKLTDISCCVPQCSSKKSTSPGVSFYYFPLEQSIIYGSVEGIKVGFSLRQKWAEQLKIEKPITDDMLVCSRHFLDTDFANLKFSTWKRLRKNVIPSQNLPGNSAFIHPVADDSNVVCLYDRNKSEDPGDITQDLVQIEVEVIYGEKSWLDFEETT